MAIYSIKDLEELTGVKAHTLRIWEKRYGIIEPQRTETNIRYYLEEDLKKLLNISILNNNGYKISKIAEMGDEEILEHISQITDIDREEQNYVDALAISLIELDSFKFHSILNHHIDQEGMEKTMFEVVYPFLEKLSLLWMSGSIQKVHELFLNNTVKQKILAAIDDIPLKKNTREPQFMLFIPWFCQQELSLLFLQYLLCVRNFRVVFLGAGVKEADLLRGIEICQPDYLVTINLDGDHNSWKMFLESLIDQTDKQIILAGAPLQLTGDMEDQIKNMGGLQSVIAYLQELQVIA